MTRKLNTILVMIMTLALTGCCLFPCYDGNPDPVENLTPKRVPPQIANDLVLRLSTVFFDEGRDYTVYLRPPTSSSTQLRQVMGLLNQKLFREPHVSPKPKGQAEYELSVETKTTADGSAAVFSVTRKGKVVWTYSEPLKKKGAR